MLKSMARQATALIQAHLQGVGQRLSIFSAFCWLVFAGALVPELRSIYGWTMGAGLLVTVALGTLGWVLKSIPADQIDTVIVIGLASLLVSFLSLSLLVGALLWEYAAVVLACAGFTTSLTFFIDIMLNR